MLSKPNKIGNLYIKSTNRNIFCSLLNLNSGKIDTSCSLRVPVYNNEYNERENLFMRGLLLGEVVGDKIINLGYHKIYIFIINDNNKGRKGVIKGIAKKNIPIGFIQSIKGYPHNGCRPRKVRRKKIRTKPLK